MLPHMTLRLLVDPIKLCLLVRNDLALAEPKTDFFLGVLDTVGAVADVATHILKRILVTVRLCRRELTGGTYNGEVSANSTWA